MWASMGLWQYDPKNCFTVCGENNPWSKFYNFWRTEGHWDCRLKVQRNFFTVNILLRGKKMLSSAVEIIHLQESRLSFYFFRSFSFCKFEFELLNTYDYKLYFKLSTYFLREKITSTCLFYLLPGRTKWISLHRYSYKGMLHVYTSIFCVHVAKETNFCAKHMITKAF